MMVMDSMLSTSPCIVLPDLSCHNLTPASTSPFFIPRVKHPQYISAAWRGSMIHSQFHTDSRLLESPLNFRHCLSYGKDMHRF